MAFNRPSLQQLTDRIRADIETKLLAGRSAIRNSVARILATAFAGATHLNYGYLDWIVKQCFPDTADVENLARWARIWGVNRKPAEFAAGTVVFTGTNGTVVPAGTEIQRSDGALFTTDADVTIASGTAEADVTASESGDAGNTDAETTLSFTSPIAGIESEILAGADGIANGIDEESDDNLRDRLVARLQEQPAGGAKADYERWALEVSGVTRAWVIPSFVGPGTVGIAFVMDEEESIIPDEDKVDEVQEYIDDPTRRPVTAAVTVYAPEALPINFTIAVSPNTAAVKAAVQAELEDLIRRKGAPDETIYLTEINEAISVAAGEINHVLTVPSADKVTTDIQIHTMGTITWV